MSNPPEAIISRSGGAGSRRKRGRRFGAAALVACALLLTTAPGVAVAKTPVDPAIMQPPLNPTFDWSCWRNANRTVCEGERRESWSGETGLECGADMVYSTWTDTRWMRRTGDEQGRALTTHVKAHIDETLGLNPDMVGQTLRGFGRFNEHITYKVPGDPSSRIVAVRGNDATIVGQGVGLVLHEVGVKIFDSEWAVLFTGGPHPLLEDFEGAVAAVCDAFQR